MVLSSGNAKASLNLRQSKEGQNVQKGVISETEVALKRAGIWLGNYLLRLVGKYSFEVKEWKPKGRKLRMRTPDSKCRQYTGAGQQARVIKESSRVEDLRCQTEGGEIVLQLQAN